MRRLFRRLNNADCFGVREGQKPHATCGGPAMPDGNPFGAPRRWPPVVSLDRHKFSIVAVVLPPDGGKLEVFRIEPTSGRSVGSSASSRPSGAGCLLRGGARRVRAVAAVDEDGWLGCDVVARSLIPVHAGDRVKDRPPGREEARVACTGWGRGGSCMPPADPQSRAGPRSSDRDRQGAGQRRTARPARGVGIDDMPGDDT